MTNQKHTPGKLIHDGMIIAILEFESAKYKEVFEASAQGSRREQKANAVRLVECWNAHDALIAENARLRQALQRLLRAFEADSEQMPESTILDCWQTNSTAIAQARKALAAQGGEA